MNRLPQIQESSLFMGESECFFGKLPDEVICHIFASLPNVASLSEGLGRAMLSCKRFTMIAVGGLGERANLNNLRSIISQHLEVHEKNPVTLEDLIRIGNMMKSQEISDSRFKPIFKKIRNLDLSKTQLNQEQIHDILSLCPDLEALDLNLCWTLKDLDLSNQKNLRTLNLEQCWHVESIKLPNKSTVITLLLGGCKMLKVLDLSMETKLEKISINDCWKLETIDLSKQIDLRMLDITEGNCSELDLSGQKNLEELYLSQSLVRVLDLTNLVSLKKVDLSECEKLTHLTLPKHNFEMNNYGCIRLVAAR